MEEEAGRRREERGWAGSHRTLERSLETAMQDNTRTRMLENGDHKRGMERPSRDGGSAAAKVVRSNSART
eukprot:755712-Rhodomonas_salina.5